MAGPFVGVIELDVADVERDGGHVEVDRVIRVGPEDPSAGGHEESVEASVAAAAVAREDAAGRLSIVPMRGGDGGVFGALVCAGLDEFGLVDLDDAHGCSPAVVSVLAWRVPPGEGQVGRAAPLVLHRCGLH